MRRQGTGQPVDLVDDDNIDLAVPDVMAPAITVRIAVCSAPMTMRLLTT